MVASLIFVSLVMHKRCQFVNVVLVGQLWIRISCIYNSGALSRIELVHNYLVWFPCALFLVPCSYAFLD